MSDYVSSLPDPFGDERPDWEKCFDRKCPDCRLSWWLFPPVGIHYGSTQVRCIECKRVYELEAVNGK